MNDAEVSNQPKRDQIVLALAIIFSAVFTYLIWFFGHQFLDVFLAPDTGYLHYYWKLPEKMFWPRASVWILYILHQVITWWLIYKSQKNRKAYNHDLNKWNYFSLATHGFFMFAHLVQTHIWYDGLAQDTSILASQGSVILMLILVFILINDKRGLFFGKPALMPKSVVRWVKKYHGYVIAWALVFTFWYHPMEFTQGHLIGFFYMFLLMIQGSMMFTRVHLNLVWIMILEVLVLFHGTFVAIQQQQNMWPMFAFGFGFLFVVTQLYNLKLERGWNWFIQAGYIAAVIVVYSGAFNSGKTWSDINEIIRIPLIEYVLVFVVLFALWIPISIWNIIKKRKRLSKSTENVVE